MVRYKIHCVFMPSQRLLVLSLRDPATHAETPWEAVNYIHDSIPPVNQIPEFTRAVKASLNVRQCRHTGVRDGPIPCGLTI